MSNNLDLNNFFYCLHCSGDLKQISNGFECKICSAKFYDNENTICLIPKELRTDYSLTPHHNELNSLAKKIGWKPAVLEHTKKNHGVVGTEYFNEYICSESRADFRFLMPVDNNSVVLDIGSGWGNITTAFARTARSVIAVDGNLDNLRFVQLRAQQEGLQNVITIQGDACTLPIKQASCNAAVMVGVLEWVAWGKKNNSPWLLQKQALQRIHNILKPGGCLYLALENRFSFKYFLGAKEPHTNLRFISLLPDKIAQTYSRLARNQDYQEITYSLNGLQKLLHSSGFDKVDFFFPIPNYQNFRFLADFKNRDTTRFVLQQLQTHPKFSRWHNLAANALLTIPLPLERFLWPSFSVLAVKS